MRIGQVIEGVKNPTRAYQHLAKKPFVLIDKYLNYGTNVFDLDWDLLIILDACRYDLFVEFSAKHPVHDRLESVEPMYSIASKTPDWLERTFQGADASVLSKTFYVSGNGMIEKVNTDMLYGVESVWRYAKHHEARVTPPEAVTNEAIRSIETTDADRYIVHYLQPHAPFLHCIGKYNSVADGEGHPLNVWNGLRKGEFDKSEVWEDYGQNLLLVLDHVQALIEYFDGSIAISADHGNAMGEFGLYGHPGREAAPSIRRVPWARATGLGLDGYSLLSREEVTAQDVGQNLETELEHHLRDLGYRE